MKKLIVTVLLLAISFCRCTPVAAQPGQKLLENTRAEQEKPEIGAVVYASVLVMRRQPLPDTMVEFSSAARRGLTRDSFDYRGFGKPVYSVTHFIQVPGRNGGDIFNLGTILYFTDMALRRCAVYCEFEYLLQSGKIRVDKVSCKRLATDRPRTLMVVIPALAVPRNLLQLKKNHLDLMKWMMQNALQADEVPLSPEKAFYYVFAATLDRLDPGAHLRLCVSDRRGGVIGEEGGSMDENYGGWHVAILKGEFAFKIQPQFYFKAVYVPGDGGRPLLVGSYSSDLPTLSRNPGLSPQSLPPKSMSPTFSRPRVPSQSGRKPPVSPPGSGWQSVY